MSARRRPRARYAPDAEIKRALRLAREDGLSPAGLTLGADGSVQILDTAAVAALAGRGGNDNDAEAELAACREEIAKAAPTGR